MTRLLAIARVTFVMAFVMASTFSFAADNWPRWRGPNANGVASGRGYPTKWSATDNILWKFKLPGIGASTPIIWEDNIIVTGENGGKNSILCIDRSGNQRWEAKLGDHRAARNAKASGSNSSPVSDGKLIFVYFKSGDLGCLDFEGDLIWHKNLQQLYGQDTLWWDLGTSPVLTKDLVVVACMQSGGSYLVGFEKATGNLAWKHDRELNAPGESAQSYTTPVVLKQGDSERIIVLGADHVTAHDAATGKQLWIAGGLNPRGIINYRSISSPVVSNGLVIAPYARGNSLTAIRLGGEGDVTDSHVAWTISQRFADVPSPAALDHRAYVCSDRGQVHAIDIDSGKIVSTFDLPRARASYSSSPILADGHLYATNEDGITYVLKVGDQFEMVAENKLEDFTIATPVFCDGRIYLRTDAHLHCIGTK